MLKFVSRLRIFFRQSPQFIEKVPKNDACADRNIKGMFGAKLWNLQGKIAKVDDLLLYTFYFIAKNKRQLLFLTRKVVRETYTLFDLFYCDDGVSLLF